MGLLLFLLVCAVVFTWLAARSVRAGHGKLLFFIAWFLIGLAVCLSLTPPLPPLGRLLVQAWAYSLIALPVWWAISAALRHNGRSS